MYLAAAPLTWATPEKPLAELRLNQPGEAPAEMQGAAGTGVSALADDLAFDNTSAPAMGVKNGEGPGGGSLMIPGPGALNSFTLQCWYKAEAGVVGSFARLFDSKKVNVFFNKEGVQLRIGGGTAVCPSDLFRHDGEWVFFAVTYDGSLTENNVKFYAGTAGQAVELVQTAGIAEGPAEFADLYAGNIQGGNRPFAGWLDNLRLWGDSQGSGGAISEAELEKYRQADLKNVNSPQL